MKTRKIFGYVGLIISIVIACCYAVVTIKPGAMIIPIDIAIISLNIIIVVTALSYIVGRIIEKNRGGTTTN